MEVQNKNRKEENAKLLGIVSDVAMTSLMRPRRSKYRKEPNMATKKILTSEMTEVDLTLIATKAKMTRVVPSEATKIEPGRQSLCRPEVFQQGHVVVILKDGTMVEFIDGEGRQDVKRKSVRYYWTNQKDDTADLFWKRQDDYRFSVYGKVWRIHDKDSEQSLTEQYKKEAAEEAEALEAEQATAAS